MIVPVMDSCYVFPDYSVLQERPEHHEEADSEVDVQRLHVRDLWQGPSRTNHIVEN